MKENRIIGGVGLFLFMGFVGWGRTQTSISQWGMFPSIQCVWPKWNAKIEKDTLRFQWKAMNLPQNEYFKRVQLQFWNEKKRFKYHLSVPPEDTVYTMTSVRTVFRRHGRYFWRVVGWDSVDREIVSATSRFLVYSRRIEKKRSFFSYPYTIGWQYIHWMEYPEYKTFMEKLYPRAHFQSFWDVGFGFRHTRHVFESMERFFILSRGGLGAEWQPKVQLVHTPYFAISPWSRICFSWVSTGLKQYASTRAELTVGSEFSVMPGGYLVFLGGWIPQYYVRYGLKNGKIQSVSATGYEMGVRCRIPRAILPDPKIFGTELDFQRIPIVFIMGYLHDAHSGTHFSFRRIGIEYQF